ncbi:winged helix-turn-helix domain-containing protein [Shewanella nanhaiensis]|uniref:Winged helix-turn-helix domain-containing protein n=1 Tax=Shewanella nanhaiensis TaxID=2864872 RepID=A0ABS7DXH8_9GAMM|nr:winged helix-turn-helix domain-containing protein [Shewanella nanhaiensis]MBW8182138.1 winged helix-turn-helix domain-containing protein [Shewanella nanhaiensis]
MSLSCSSKVMVNEVEVDFVALKLLIDGEWLEIEARQLALLKLLIKHHGEAVPRNLIMDEIWHDTIVSDNSVSQAITQLRKSLQDDKGTPRFIRTVPRVGYQLIATIEEVKEPESLEGLSVVKRTSKSTTALIGIALGMVLMFGLFQLTKPSLSLPTYEYETRLTSVPGPEGFLRYSPDGRYLAFSQISDNRSQMDLVVYDSQTETIHSIKSTGYSEEAPEWSPDSQWLIYYRHDPLSCDIRIMSVSTPVETWRLSPDRHLGDCEPGYSRQKMHWVSADTLYRRRWRDNQAILTKISLSYDDSPQIVEQRDLPEFSPLLMDIDKESLLMLLVEKRQNWFELRLVDLANLTSEVIDRSEQDYWGLKWHNVNESFWLGNNSLRLMSLDGESEVVHDPIGFIPDIDVNRVTQQLAYSEGQVNVNLYNIDLHHQSFSGEVKSRQVSSSARTDILPTMSKEGDQMAFVSFQRGAADGLSHVEIWLKHKHKKAASLLTNLAENIKPDYLLWSPNGENILLGDTEDKLYLINTFSRHMVPIVSGYEQLDAVVWSADGKRIYFSALDEGEWRPWMYDLQLGTSTPVEETAQEKGKAQDVLLSHLNPSFINYSAQIADFLSLKLAPELGLYDLQPSLSLYRPAITKQGIYYVVRQGLLLKLYYYEFDTSHNRLITHIGNHEQDFALSLSVSASDDGKRVVYSKVENVETDILLQRKMELDK